MIGVFFVMQSRTPQTARQPAVVQEAPRQQNGAGHDHPHSGKVLETMDSGNYTYVYVDTGDERVWAAGPRTQLEVGSVVSFEPGMEMSDFKSETLDRTFPSIYFVSELRTGAETMETSGHPTVPPPATDMDFAGISVPDGGSTIANLYSGKSSLAGKSVIVRGKVVKVTEDVMDKNWIHIMDGTGDEGANDLTVTTDAVPAIGDIVVVRGEMAIDKDFGFGYKYGIIIENAEVTVEEVH
jgi:hypothetical protein